MVVYVDDMMRAWRPPHRRDRVWKMSHLFASTVEELHEFARKIGCSVSWFQNRPGFPHYDVPMARRELALRHGAVPIRYRELPAKLRELGLGRARSPIPAVSTPSPCPETDDRTSGE